MIDVFISCVYVRKTPDDATDQHGENTALTSDHPPRSMTVHQMFVFLGFFLKDNSVTLVLKNGNICSNSSDFNLFTSWQHLVALCQL